MIAHALIIPDAAFDLSASVEARNIAYCRSEEVTVYGADEAECLAKLDRLCQADCMVDDISFENELD